MNELLDRNFIGVLVMVTAGLLLGSCGDQSGGPETQAGMTGTETGNLNNQVVCGICGTVRSITPVEIEGEGSGIGAAIGAIVGGLAGNQVGGGSGRKLATVAGAVGGAIAGNTIEGNRKDQTYYEVVIDMEDGSQQILTVPDASTISAGSEVTVEGTLIQPQ